MEIARFEHAIVTALERMMGNLKSADVESKALAQPEHRGIICRQWGKHQYLRYWYWVAS